MATEKTRRSSDTIREQMTHVEAPLANSPTTYPAVRTEIDPDKLLRAWNANIATMKELIRVVEKCESDNRKTRFSNIITRVIVIAVLVVVMTVAGFIHVKGRMRVDMAIRIEHNTAVTNAEILETANAVANTIAKASEAQVMSDDLAGALNGPMYPPAAAAGPDSVGAAMQARLEALDAALEVQERVGDIPAKKAVQAKRELLKKRAEDSGLKGL